MALVIQGLKQLGLNVEGNPAKVVMLTVAAIFLFANGLIDAFVPDSARPVKHTNLSGFPQCGNPRFARHLRIKSS